MTLSELIEKAENIVEETYTHEIWESMVYTILADLNPIAKILISEEVDITLTGEAGEVDLAELETDFYEILSVSYKPTGKRKMILKKLPPFDSASVGWYREENFIQLQNIHYGVGKVVVDGYAMLTLTEDEDNLDKTLNLPQKYHEVVLKGVMAVAMQKEEEYDRKSDFFGEYMMAKKQMQAERIMEMEPWYAQIVAPTRIGG